MKKLTTEEFIKRSIEIHGDKYDYSKVRYTNAKEKVIINCKKHGDFTIRPYNHLGRGGCSKCGVEKKHLSITHKKEDVINRFKKIHKNKYCYKLVDYKNCETKIIITCPVHGNFKQKPVQHYRGQGCPTCGIEKVKKSQNVRVGYRLSKWLEFCKSKNIRYPQVYIIKCINDSEQFIKIGISTDVKKRIANIKRNKFNKVEALNTIMGSPIDVWNLEKRLHKAFKKYKHIPLVKFGGYTECFNMTSLKLLKESFIL